MVIGRLASCSNRKYIRRCGPREVHLSIQLVSFVHVLTHVLTDMTELLVPSAQSECWSSYCPTAHLASGALPVSFYRAFWWPTPRPSFHPFNFPLCMSPHELCFPGVSVPCATHCTPPGMCLDKHQGYNRKIRRGCERVTLSRKQGTTMKEVNIAPVDCIGKRILRGSKVSLHQTGRMTMSVSLSIFPYSSGHCETGK